jgi:DNA-binding winged helix-turn-helix (wHTH) protein
VAETAKRVYEFGRFRLDADERLLERDGNPLPLTPKLFDTLLLLVKNGGHLMSKDELMKKLWPDSFVEEVNLSQNVSRLRKILEETPNQRFISTVAGQGYRFVAEVREVVESPQTGNARSNRIVPQVDFKGAVVDRGRRSGGSGWVVRAAAEASGGRRFAGGPSV